MKRIKIAEAKFNSVLKPLVSEIKWNGNGEEYPGLIPPEQIPPILYHVSNKVYRNSILNYGILASVGDEFEDWWNYEGPNGEQPDMNELPECVFLTSNPRAWYDNLDDEDEYDIWGIDVNQLDNNLIYLDPDRSMRNKGSFVYTSDISPKAIKLINGSKLKI